MERSSANKGTATLHTSLETMLLLSKGALPEELTVNE